MLVSVLVFLSLYQVISSSPYDHDTVRRLAHIYGLPRKDAERAHHALNHLRRYHHNITWPSTKGFGADYNCPHTDTAHVATTVHNLRPRDIQAIGAVGDSLTAAYGAEATSVWGVLDWPEYRGLSWSIGGLHDVNTQITLPNVIKYFQRPSYMKGYSTGETHLAQGPLDVAVAHMNQARSGGHCDTLAPHVGGGKWLHEPGEVVNITDVAKKQLGVNFAKAWKLVTLFIGGNDLCRSCDCETCNLTRAEPTYFRKEVKAALDYLKANMPRTFVALVLPVDVTKLKVLNTQSASCGVLHPILCPCGTSDNEAWLKTTREKYAKYTSELEALVNEYEHTDDFTVVTQPFFKHTEIPTVDGKPDLSYFAPDCFHFSGKAHAQAGLALWNNLIQPVDSKRTDWHFGEKLACPPNDQFLCTVRNKGKNGC